MAIGEMSILRGLYLDWNATSSLWCARCDPREQHRWGKVGHVESLDHLVGQNIIEHDICVEDKHASYIMLKEEMTGGG
jgi:hypothetical protein